MSKLVGTLFLVVIVAIVGGAAALSFLDVPVQQDTVSSTTTLEEFRKNTPS